MSIRIGLIVEEVPKSIRTVSTNKGRTTGKCEITKRRNNCDKQTGSYVRKTSKQSYSGGDYSNRGKTGYKNEFKTSSTVRVGDKGGYTEYHKQVKVTKVKYDGGTNSGGSKGHKNSCGGGKKYISGSNSGGSKGCNNCGGGGKKYLY